MFLRRQALQQPHFLWIDNFSKFIARSIPTADKGIFSQCLWTGVSLFALPDGVGEEVSDNVQVKDNGRIVSAMPRDILQCQGGVVAAVHHVLSLGPKYSQNSAVYKYDVRSIPLKVDTNKFHEVSEVVNSYNMRCVRAVDLLEHNIGSNRGLLAVLDGICREKNIHGDEQCTKYTTFNVDENIFWRVLKVIVFYLCCYVTFFLHMDLLHNTIKNLFRKFLRSPLTEKFSKKILVVPLIFCDVTLFVKVMYDRSEAGRCLRTYAGCSLAWWHSYKWATKRIMLVYANDFIAPLFHYLFPTRQFDANKCSHTAATTILSYIRLAYPGFKDPLQELLANPTTQRKQRTILQNLQHLCEYFIPVVCIFSCFVLYIC